MSRIAANDWNVLVIGRSRGRPFVIRRLTHVEWIGDDGLERSRVGWMGELTGVLQGVLLR